MSNAFPEFSVDELTATHKGAMKIGPFGSQLRKEEMVEHGVKVYGQENVISDDWMVGERRISPSKFRALSSCELEPGDLVVSMMGTAGKCAVFPANAERGIMDSHLLRIQPNLALVDRAYFAIALQAENVVGRQVTAMSHGSIMAGLSSKIVKRFKLPLPPLGEQPKIVEVLRALDTAIHETEAIIAKLKAVKQGLLHDLLTRGIDANGELRPPQAEAPHLYKPSPLGWIPKEWEETSLGEIARRSGGILQTGPFGSQLHAHEYVIDGVPVVMPQDMVDGELSTENIARITERKANALSRHRVKPNDLVFSRRGDLSRCVAIGDQHTGWLCGTGCLLARLPRAEINAYWLALVYQQPVIQSQVMGRAVGSTMANLNTSILEAILIGRPAVNEQDEIARRVAGASLRIRAEEQELQKLRLEKSGLMDDLLTGRVRVTPLLQEPQPA